MARILHLASAGFSAVFAVALAVGALDLATSPAWAGTVATTACGCTTDTADTASIAVQTESTLSPSAAVSCTTPDDCKPLKTCSNSRCFTDPAAIASISCSQKDCQ